MPVLIPRENWDRDHFYDQRNQCSQNNYILYLKPIPIIEPYGTGITLQVTLHRYASQNDQISIYHNFLNQVLFTILLK